MLEERFWLLPLELEVLKLVLALEVFLNRALLELTRLVDMGLLLVWLLLFLPRWFLLRKLRVENVGIRVWRMYNVFVSVKRVPKVYALLNLIHNVVVRFLCEELLTWIDSIHLPVFSRRLR